MIENQHVKIRRELEIARSALKNSRRAPLYANLIYRVSGWCMDLIAEQVIRRQNLGVFVKEQCGCRVLMTHWIPCACLLATIMTERPSLYLEDVHPFFRTLEVGEGGYVPDVFGEDRQSQDKSRLRKLVSEAECADPALMRYVIQLMEQALHPGDHAAGEPMQNMSRKGRPRMSKSTRRDPSAFEYGRPRGRGQGRQSSSSRGTSPSSKGRGRTASRSTTGGTGTTKESQTSIDFQN